MSEQATDVHLNPVKILHQLEDVLSDNSIIVADGGDFVGTAAYVLRYDVAGRDVRGNGIPNGNGNPNPMGIGIKHGIGDRNGRETTLMGMGITSTRMGIYSHRFFCCV